MPRVLVVGAGGIGHPVAWTLARAGGLELVVVDDDVVEASNLHRQILFEDADVGREKALTLAARLAERCPGVVARGVVGRFLPSTAANLLEGVDVVVDGADNFASRFLVADACFLAGVPVVHAASVGLRGTVLGARAGGRPCYRCLFEDLPEGPAPDCATAGVVGPLCGVVGALGAEVTLRLLAGRGGSLFVVDGDRLSIRELAPRARAGCALCGDAGAIRDLDPSRYAPPEACGSPGAPTKTG